MPGILKRTYDQSNSTERIAVGSGAISTAERPSKKMRSDSLTNGTSRANGAEPLTNGVHANGSPPGSVMSSEALAAVAEKISGQLPPEIEHITVGYLPLATLVTRLAQDTFNGLEQVVNRMADVQMSSTHNQPQVNGTSSHLSSQANVQKKNILWDFAHENRARFIKCLVLSQWSRQAEAVSKVININNWMEGRKHMYNEAGAWVGELKRLIAPMKVPSPDLKTGLEVLSTGKASWLPDLGFIPPDPLTPQQLLKALRTVNVLLSIRLNIHETIPPPFRDFTIRSGRATFRVQDEFELDLSIADEDPLSQLYFIDFRFLFSPCSTEIPLGRLRDEIERKTNDVLHREGLKGCFDFLHDLVLTHKLRILRQQANDLARQRWSENVRVEGVHRSLVIQYWLNRPGGKNWIEIGVKRNRRKGEQSTGTIPNVPYVGLRWHRKGKEVIDPEIKINMADLSIETILKQVIATHTNHILKEMKRKLREGSIYSKKALFVKHRASKKEPADCSLKIQVTTSTVVTVAIEPISGSFAVMPASQSNSVVERELNLLKDPASEAPSRIAVLRCRIAQEQIESRAYFIGWEPAKGMIPSQEIVRKMFSPDIVRLAIFKIKPWNSEWMIASTTSMHEDAWWIVRTQDEKSSIKVETGKQSNSTRKRTLQVAFKIFLSRCVVLDPSYQLLSRLENAAASMICQIVDMQELAAGQIPCIQQESPKSRRPHRTPDLFIQHLEQLSSGVQTFTQSDTSWCHELVKLTVVGLSRARDSVLYTGSARLIEPIKAIGALASSIDSSVSFHPTNGTFIFPVTIAVGQSSISALRDRLRRIKRLIQFLAVIEKQGFQCEIISLSRLVFIYHTTLSSQILKADIDLAADATVGISFGKDSPHLRIQDLLTMATNETHGFEHTGRLLSITLPLLRAFDAIEQSTLRQNHRDEKNPICILPHSPTSYCIIYEYPKAMFRITLDQRLDDPVWFLSLVDDVIFKDENGRDEVVATAWTQLCQESSQNWKGMRKGVIAGVEGIEELIPKIDEMMATLSADKLGNEDELAKGDIKKESDQKNEVVVLD